MSTNNNILKGALITGVANGVINAAINWFTVRDHTDLVIASPDIASMSHSVIASSLFLACSLAFILTGIAYFTFKTDGQKPPFFPTVFMLALWNTLIAFITMALIAAALSVMAGGFHVGPGTSVAVTAVVAFCVAALIEYSTKVRLLRRSTIL